MAATNVSFVCNCGSHMKWHKTWSVARPRTTSANSSVPNVPLQTSFSGAVRSENVVMYFLKL